MISKEQWVDWKNHPVTQDFLMALQEQRQVLLEGLAEGQSGSEREDCMVIGRAQALKDAIEYAIKTFDYIQIEDSNAQSGSVSDYSEG